VEEDASAHTVEEDGTEPPTDETVKGEQAAEEEGEAENAVGPALETEEAAVVEVEDEGVPQDNEPEIADAEGTPSNLDKTSLESEADVSIEGVGDEEDKQLPVVTRPDEALPEVITSVPEVPPTQEIEDLEQDDETDEHLPGVTGNNPDLPTAQGNEDLKNDEESDEHLPVVTEELTPNTECGHQDAPHVFHTITIGGFPAMIGGYNRSSLNGDYAEVACDPISGRETYWKGKAGPLLFYCKSQKAWLVSMPDYLPQAREEIQNCIGFARGSIGKDILAPEFMPFNRTYNHEITGWQNLTEVAVTAFTVQDSP